MENRNSRQFRVMVADFHQETNSFNPYIWTEDKFRNDTFLEGDAIVTGYGTNSGRVLCGILKSCKAHNAEIIPACALRATSGGPVDHAVVEHVMHSLLACYEANAPIDAVILGLHGATQSTEEDDVCGYILEKLRTKVGSEVVISVGFDLHANVTARCLDAADYICGYQTYPHVDQKETGFRAAELAFRKLETGKKLAVSSVTLPMIVPASGYSTNTSPMREIMAYGHEQVENGTLLDFTAFQMQPWLDVWPAGSTVVTVSEDAEAAAACARELAKRIFESRDAFWPELDSIPEVISLSKEAPEGKPVILVDFADSLGAGATGESAAVLRALADVNFPVRTAMVVSDSAAVNQATALGIGAEAEFRIGNPTIDTQALTTTAQVVNLCDGVFYQEGPVGAGMRRNMGRVAVLRVKNVDVLVCDHACGTGDLQAYRHFGIEPTGYQMVVVKANTSFRAAYTPIASKICMTDTPGAATSHLEALSFRRISQTFYPFTHLDEYRMDPPRCSLR